MTPIGRLLTGLPLGRRSLRNEDVTWQRSSTLGATSTRMPTTPPGDVEVAGRFSELLCEAHLKNNRTPLYGQDWAEWLRGDDANELWERANSEVAADS